MHLKPRAVSFLNEILFKWGKSRRNLLEIVAATTIVLGPLGREGQQQSLLIHSDEEEQQLSLIHFCIGVDVNVSGDISKQFCLIDDKEK